MIILNLGCGGRTCSSENVKNIDWSLYLRLKRSKVLAPLALRVLRGHRLDRFKNIPDNILVHNLKKGIPFDDDSVDAVYHSHMLEHLDRDSAGGFLCEAFRVLKPGGVHRVVVPDMEFLARAYIKSIDTARSNESDTGNIEHEEKLGALIEQSVRRQPAAAQQQSTVQRIIEGFILGDARRRGETHQWMYDEITLSISLSKVGFQKIRRLTHETSGILDWDQYALDQNEDGTPYKPNSLYMEAVK